MSPSRRSAVGILFVVLMIVVWAVLVSTVYPYLVRWPWPAQALFFLAAGLLWVIPLKPLVRWTMSGDRS